MAVHKTKEDYLKSNIVVKQRSGKMMIGLLIVAFCIITGSIGQIVMKKGLTNVGGLKISDLITPRIFSVFFNPWILIGLFLYGVSMVFWLVALSSFDVSFMYPLVSFAYVLTTFLAIIFLKEHVTLFRWAGVLLIVGGSFLMLRS